MQYVHVLSKLKATCILTFYKVSEDFTYSCILSVQSALSF